MRDNLFHASTAESIGSRHAGTYPHAKMRIGCRMRTAGENATNCGGLIRRYLKRAPVPPHRARGRRLVASRLPLPPPPPFPPTFHPINRRPSTRADAAIVSRNHFYDS